MKSSKIGRDYNHLIKGIASRSLILAVSLCGFNWIARDLEVFRIVEISGAV
jgi:hypothetical protein